MEQRANQPPSSDPGALRPFTLPFARTPPSADFEQYLELLEGFLVQLDTRGIISYVSPRVCTVLGDRREVLIGRSWFEDVLPERAREIARQAFDRLLTGELTRGALVEYPIRAPGQAAAGSDIPWRHVAIADEGDRVVGVLLIGFDVAFTPGGVLTRPLKELRDLKFALDVSTIVAITDVRGTITWVNDRFCQISKYSREELMGQNHRIVNSGHHPASFFKEMWATIGRGKVWSADIQNRAKDGSRYWVATTIVPFLDERGAPYQYLSLRHEITARKQAEDALVEANRRILEEQAKLVQAEKLSSIGLLASGVAHEINNPLSGVLGCLKALRERQQMSESRREEYFETVLEGLERIQQTVRGLLDFARQRPPRLEVLDLEEVVTASLRLIAPAIRKKALVVTSELVGGRAPRVRSDRSQLVQALVNLLLNAVYAAPEASELSIEVAKAAGRVGIRIIDHGAGIPPELLGRVCDPFFSTKPEGEGTGLGLAVTLSILRANGGDLTLESEPGRGTRVTAWMQAVDLEAEAGEASSSLDSSRHSRDRSE